MGMARAPGRRASQEIWVLCLSSPHCSPRHHAVLSPAFRSCLGSHIHSQQPHKCQALGSQAGACLRRGTSVTRRGAPLFLGSLKTTANRGLGQGEGTDTQILAMLCLSPKPNPFRNPKISCSPPAFAEDEVSKHDISCHGGTSGAGTCQQSPARVMTRQGDPCELLLVGEEWF